MTAPLWVVVLLGAFSYLFIGVAQAILMAFLDGRRGLRTPDGLLFFLTFCWPLEDLLMLVHWTAQKYVDLLEAVWKRGKESVKPAENEQPGRRIG